MSTVGYGDISCTTRIGKNFQILFLLIGLVRKHTLRWKLPVLKRLGRWFCWHNQPETSVVDLRVEKTFSKSLWKFSCFIWAENKSVKVYVHFYTTIRFIFSQWFLPFFKSLQIDSMFCRALNLIRPSISSNILSATKWSQANGYYIKYCHCKIQLVPAFEVVLFDINKNNTVLEYQASLNGC